jgi:hypothetical protein
VISLLNPLIAPVKRAASQRVSKSDLQVEDPGQEQQETRLEPQALNDISLTCQWDFTMVLWGDFAVGQGVARSGLKSETISQVAILARLHVAQLGKLRPEHDSREVALAPLMAL